MNKKNMVITLCVLGFAAFILYMYERTPQNIDKNIYIVEKQVNNKTVTCLVYSPSSNKGGIDCDWNSITSQGN